MCEQGKNELLGDGQPAAQQSDRPLVTFALFAYNQEKYIREAVEGALSQTYEPLEIILSDDSSTDRTFQIMQEMAARYRGPHAVRAVRQASNLGTVNHLITAARLASGELFVVNAGDDISYPDRVEELVSHWQSTGASALSSFHDEIAEDGAVLRRNCSFPVSAAAQLIFKNSKTARRVDGFIQSVPGFSAAYRRKFWSDLPLSDRKILVEDGLAGAILNIRGERIERVKKSLIAYRFSSTSLTARQDECSREAIMRREEKINAAARSAIYMTDYILDNALPRGGTIEQSVVRGLKTRQEYCVIVHNFWDESIFMKSYKLMSARSRIAIFFIISRLFGKNVFILMKLMTGRAGLG
jgi:cellulose synthase/poly-beta-1,6-N-acetylglucosamine synthase-like glycosyltransferase